MVLKERYTFESITNSLVLGSNWYVSFLRFFFKYKCKLNNSTHTDGHTNVVYFLWITASAYTTDAPSIGSRNNPTQNCRRVYDFRPNIWVLLLPYSGPRPNVNNCIYIFNRICFYINKRATDWHNETY